MPVDATIALAGKPPVIPALDVNKTFLTLGQLKYLNAETQALTLKTGREQEIFERSGAVSGLLSSLDTFQPGTPATSGQPALAPLSALQHAPGRSNALAPAPGTLVNPGAGTTYAPYPPEGQAAQPATPGTPARRALNILDPEVQAEVYRLGGAAAPGLLTTALENHAKGLKSAQDTLTHRTLQLDTAVRALDVLPNTREGYATWHLLQASFVDPEVMAKFPPPSAWTPELMPKLKASSLSVLQQHETAMKEGQLKVNEANAETQASLARTEAAKVGPLTTQADAAKQQAGAAETTAEGYELQPTGDGYVVFRKKTGEATRPGGATGGLGLTPAQAVKVQELNTAYMDQNKAFIEARDAYGRVQAGAKQNTGPGDIAMLYGIGKLNDPGAVVQPGQMAHLEQVGTAWQGLWKEYNRLVSDPSARLDPTVRANYLKTAEATHARQVADHQKHRTDTHKRGRTVLPGIDPDTYAPDLTSTATPRTATPEAKAGATPTGAPSAPAASPAFGKPPPPGSSKPKVVTSVTLKELQETIDLANEQGKKTPQGKPYTMDYLKKYFEDNGVKVRP